MANKYDKTELLFAPISKRIYMASPLKGNKMFDTRKDVTDMAITVVATKLSDELENLPKYQKIVGRMYTDSDFALVGMSLETLKEIRKFLKEQSEVSND